MNLLVLLGSRNPEGQTARAAGALVRGAEAEGAQCEQLFLPEMRVERCRQCDARGWGTCSTEGRCCIDDDFAALTDKVRRADLVVFATPVYWGDLSESLRAFLDRLRRTTVHQETRKAYEGKPAVGVCVAGGGGGGAPSCDVSLERIVRTCGFDLVDVVPVRRQNLELKLLVLETTGKWLAGR